MTHKGYGQYVKGDGDAFSDFLELKYPHISNAGLSRADFASRQDWSLEVSFELYPLLEPLLDYECQGILGKHLSTVMLPFTVTVVHRHFSNIKCCNVTFEIVTLQNRM